MNNGDCMSESKQVDTSPSIMEVFSSKFEKARDAYFDVSSTFISVVAPVLLESLCPGAGTGLSAGLAFYNLGQQRKFEKFCKDLDEQLKLLDLEIEELKKRCENRACFVVEVMNSVLKDRHENRITFYVGITTEIIENITEEEIERDLKLKSVKIISDLSDFELILLEAMSKRSRGEVWDVPKRRGSGFLVAGVTITPTTLAYIDSLIQAGLVSDVSVEKIQQGQGVNQGRVDGRSVIRISDLGRSVIAYMIAFRETKKSKKD